MSFPDQSFQDWERVTINRKKRKNEAAPAGGPSELVPKNVTGLNKKAPDTNMAKLDRETDVQAHKKVPLNVSRAIQRARLDKKMKQSELAVKIKVKEKVINDYESGKAIPDNSILARIEKALGTKLPRPPKKK